MKNCLFILFLFPFFYSWSQSNGNDMYDDSYLHEIRISFETDFFWDSLESYYTFAEEKIYLMGSIEIDGITTDSIGVRKKGMASTFVGESLKIPFKVDFNEYVSGQKYDGLKKLNLHNGWHDPTMMREVLAYKFIRDIGVAAPRTSYTKLYINDTYWGLYILVEHIDNRFLKNWFENDNGNLWKAKHAATLDWSDTELDVIKNYIALKTNQDLDNWDNFLELIDVIENETDFDEEISNYMNIDGFTKSLVADKLMQNFDSYYQPGRNFYMYYDSTNSQFEWLPWDYNLSFSNWETTLINDDPEYNKILAKRVMHSPVYRELYFNYCCLFIENYFNLDYFETFIDNNVELIEEALDEDENKLFSMEDFYQNIDGDMEPEEDWGFPPVLPGLKPFFSDRATAVLAELADFEHSCTALTIDEISADLQFQVYPNPSQTGMFNFVIDESFDECTVYSVQGDLIKTAIVSPNNLFELDLSRYPNGIYFVKFTGADKIVRAQIVKS